MKSEEIEYYIRKRVSVIVRVNKSITIVHYVLYFKYKNIIHVINIKL